MDVRDAVRTRPWQAVPASYDAQMPQILILAALAQEADALFAGQGESVAQSPFVARRVGDVTIVTCGLGKVNAATAAALWAERVQPAALLMSGTCGRLSDIAGDAFWLAEAVQHDYGAARAEGFVAYPAGDWPMGDAVVRPFAAMPDPGLGLPHARIASGDSFLECPDAAARLVAAGCHLVDMEVAAVAQVAATLGLPWAAVKAPTDEANGASAGDFHANLLAAAARAARAVEALMGRLQ
jgi:adenosylhomocysteine nucleosidase